MTVTIQWVNQKKSMDKLVTVRMPVANLQLIFTGKVLIATKWKHLEEVILKEKGCEIAFLIKNHLNTPTTNIELELKKQGTSYRKAVWEEICKIPVGQVLSYSQLAKNLNSGARAVANACRDNPFPGIIPCHRVVAKNGLGGYMGQTSGEFLELKRKLLSFELQLMESKYESFIR